MLELNICLGDHKQITSQKMRGYHEIQKMVSDGHR